MTCKCGAEGTLRFHETKDPIVSCLRCHKTFKVQDGELFQTWASKNVTSQLKVRPTAKKHGD